MDIPPSVEPLIDALAERLNKLDIGRPAMVGVHTGGVWIAERLHKKLALDTPLGMLNINFYRDDFTRIGLHPRVTPSNLPFGVDDRNIVLVDDVLHTGRTIRAALNEIFDYGRPASVTLAVLIDRDGHDLPIRADAAGQQVALSDNQHIKLTGPDPLNLVIQEVE